MNQQPIKRYGITDPVSLAPPTERDKELTKSLENLLIEFNLFESSEESARREEILGKLNVIVKEWVREVSMKQGLSEQIAIEAGAKIFTFGSYRLGVCGPGTDIDTLCVVPRNITRDDFFTSLFEILNQNSEISDITCVPDAYVPIMKLYFSGVQIDLLCSSLPLSMIPDNLDLLEFDLKNCDDKSILSVNGCRVTDQILKLVPDIPNFRMTLRCIKKWAKQRAIYSNPLGFLGGVAWAMLTARICQLYPNAATSTLVSRFFRVYAQWKWPNPILLNKIEDGGPLSKKVWNPKINHRDRTHCMPIITPAYPAINSTYNVSESTKRILVNEFQRGLQIAIKIEKNEAEWKELFEKLNFFQLYNTYLQIICYAEQANQKKWSPYVESRLRMIIPKIEQTQGLEYAHPYTLSFDFVEDENNCTAFFIGLKFQKTKIPSNQVDLTIAVVDFKKQVEDWPNKTADMKISIKCVKQSSLPDFVFEGGVRPPVKRVRRTKPKVEESVIEVSGINKRPREEETQEEGDRKRFRSDKTETTNDTSVPPLEEPLNIIEEPIGTTVSETSIVVEQPKSFTPSISGPVLDGSEFMHRKAQRQIFGTVAIKLHDSKSS
jgi:poly(A) polymerase